jgi:tetratricopeptide (TPR) repeat protein
VPEFASPEAQELWKHAEQLKSEGRREEALETLARLREREPQNPAVPNRMGVILVELGRRSEAEDHFCSAVGCDPHYAPAITNVGNIRYEEGRYQEAVAKYNEALAVDPSYANAHNNLAAALRRLGQYGAAVRSLKRAHALQRGGWDRQSRAEARETFRKIRGKWGCLIAAVIVLVVIVYALTR